MSQSVADRRRTGRSQKQEFYEAQLADAAERAQALDGELGEMTAGTRDSFKPEAREAIAGAPDRLKAVGDRLRAESAGFAQCFRDIVADPPRRLPPGARSKLAVVYVDGNGFGRARAARGHDPVLLGRFSRYLQVRGGLLLADLIAWMLDRRLFVETAPEEEEAPRRLRFETLMWGGDEVCFVLPAWEGMAFMAQLGRSLAGWQKPELGPPGERPHAGLTFAAGMAIGQEKTPIRVLRDAACQLAEAAKANREASHLQVLSLEGIDRAAFNLAALRGAAFRPGPVPEAGTFSLDLERIDAVIEGVLTIKREVGRSQLQHWYSRAARDGRLGESNGGAAAGLRDQMLQRLGELGAGEAALAVLRGDLLAAGAGDHLFLPLHQLLELWDFVQPEATA